MIPIILDPDAPKAIHGVDYPDDISPIQNPIVYESSPSITLNNPVDPQNDTFAIEDVSISPAIDEVVEPNADRDGTVAGEPREVQKIITMRGWVRAPTYAKLYDKIAALNRAFHPVNTYASDVATASYDIGFLPLKFKVPTTDTANWSGGYISQQYRARSIVLPVPTMTRFDDIQARFVIVLRLADPRRYEQTERSASRTGNGSMTADNTLATYPSWPTIEIAFATAPSADFNITRATVPTLNRVIHIKSSALTDAAGKTLIIDSQYRTAKYSDGTDKTDALRADARFFTMLAGMAQTITIASAPSDAVIIVKWRRAFA